MKIENYSISNNVNLKSLVYCAKNINNNKIYIGYTKSTLYRRKIAHYAMSRQNKTNNYFKSALHKNKKEDFLWYVLFLSDSLIELKNKEKEFILLFKSNKREYGYNLTTGGEEAHFNEEVCHKISKKAKQRIKENGNPFLGKHHSDEQKEKWRINRKGICFNPGYLHSDEVKQKLSNIRKELCKDPIVILNMSKAQKKSKAIFCKTNNIVYHSIGEASRQLRIPKSTIQANLYGRNKEAKGFIFEFI